MSLPEIKVDAPMPQIASPVEPMLQFFSYDHLPPAIAAISKPFCDLAHAIASGRQIGDEDEAGNITMEAALCPRNPERTVALRKLLEAKDCAVRAVLYKS